MKKTLFILFAFSLTAITAFTLPKYLFVPEPACSSDTSYDLLPARQEMLVTRLQDKSPSDYRYFFQTFLEEEGQTYMVTNFRNETDCFDIKMLVNVWDKLDGMKRTNGKSYPRELHRLEWEIVTTEQQAVVRYVDMRRVID